jgi:hypothetical protein
MHGRSLNVGRTLVFLYLLGLLLRGLALVRFTHVLNVIREPLLGPPHSHTLYHIPANRSDATLSRIFLRFARLLVGNTGSPRVRGIMQAIFVMENMENGSVGLIWDIGEALIVGKSRT